MMATKPKIKHPIDATSRLNRQQRLVGILLYLARGWHTYTQIAEEFGCCLKSARRSVLALERAGIPIIQQTMDGIPQEFRAGTYRSQRAMVRLPLDWVARTPWLRRYIQQKEASQ